ncbi:MULTISPECIES: hypothetical protein [unclassified Moorena]|nr:MULTISPECIES: hypothetical protein [unclassified Moorena]
MGETPKTALHRYSLLPTPCSLFPVPCSLFPLVYVAIWHNKIS